MGPVAFATALLEHRDDGTDRVLPDRALLLKGAVEGLELGDAGALTHTKFGAAAADEVERGDALGDAGGMGCRQLHDAVSEANLPGALARRGEKDLRRRRVRIFL